VPRLEDQHFEVISENPGIRQFVWEHLNDINRVLQRVKKVAALSQVENDICVPEVWQLAVVAPTRDVTLKMEGPEDFGLA